MLPKLIKQKNRGCREISDGDFNVFFKLSVQLSAQVYQPYFWIYIIKKNVVCHVMFEQIQHRPQLCLLSSRLIQHQQRCCKVRNSREDLCAPARRQCEETGPQISSRIYGSAAVAGHWHGDPQHDDCHYGRNQLHGSRSVSLLLQAQDAQHQQASAHNLVEAKTSTVKQGFLNDAYTNLSLTWSRKLLPKVKNSEG